MSGGQLMTHSGSWADDPEPKPSKKQCTHLSYLVVPPRKALQTIWRRVLAETPDAASPCGHSDGWGNRLQQLDAGGWSRFAHAKATWEQLNLIEIRE